jgi:hypothetical protein
MKTDTPRTDSAKVDKGGMTFVWVEFAQQLERELTECQAQSHGLARRVVEAETKLEVAKAEVDRLRAEKNACLNGNEYYGDKAVILQDKINRAIDVLMEKIK